MGHSLRKNGGWAILLGSMEDMPLSSGIRKDGSLSSGIMEDGLFPYEACRMDHSLRKHGGYAISFRKN